MTWNNVKRHFVAGGRESKQAVRYFVAMVSGGECKAHLDFGDLPVSETSLFER
jgi:hypothetical protein